MSPRAQSRGHKIKVKNMSKSILLKIENKVAFITLNRPEVFNSFNREMALSLQGILDDCETNNDIRAIVITGSGKAFCAGQDLQEVTDPNGPELTSIVRDHYNPIIERIRNIEKPIIAAVNGVAAGAGANIALACDICVATESSSFIQAFSKIGFAELILLLLHQTLDESNENFHQVLPKYSPWATPIAHYQLPHWL